MDRNEAREYFKKSGLNYEIITSEDIKTLSEILSNELNEYHINGGDHAKQMDLKVSKLRVKDVKVLKSGLKYARLQVDGSYFRRREAITFSQTGFIGFGGELDDKNVRPILKAFCKWCELIAS